MSWKGKLHIESTESSDRSDRSPIPAASITVSAVAAPPAWEVAHEPDPIAISWPEWKAAALNRLFQEQGVTGQPGRITAATIRHGETGGGRVDSRVTNERPMSRAEVTE